MSQQQRLLGGTLCLDFINTAGGGPHESELSTATVNRVHRFRIALRRLLDAEARGIGASAEDLAVLNRILAMSGARRGLVPTVRGYGWGWLDRSAGPELLLWPIAFSAARLLEGPDLARLKACDACGRLFVDASHNRSRRWCDMQTAATAQRRRGTGRERISFTAVSNAAAVSVSLLCCLGCAHRADPGSKIVPATLSAQPAIPYPPDLFGRKIEGEVVLYLVVDSTGAAIHDSTRVASSSGQAAFDAAALDAAPALRFAPARRGEIPVTAPLLVPIRFILPDSIKHPRAPK